MTIRITGIFAAAVLCGICLAQETTQVPAPSADAPPAQAVPSQSSPPQPAASSQTQTSASQRIAPGSVIPVRLTRSIDAKKTKTRRPRRGESHPGLEDRRWPSHCAERHENCGAHHGGTGTQ
jgi:hypothetical protein